MSLNDLVCKAINGLEYILLVKILACIFCHIRQHTHLILFPFLWRNISNKINSQIITSICKLHGIHSIPVSIRNYNSTMYLLSGFPKNLFCFKKSLLFHSRYVSFGRFVLSEQEQSNTTRQPLSNNVLTTIKLSTSWRSYLCTLASLHNVSHWKTSTLHFYNRCCFLYTKIMETSWYVRC